MSVTEVASRGAMRGLWAVLALLALELLALSVIYKHAIDFTCLDNWPKLMCRGASGLMVSAYTLIAALALYAMLARDAVARLLAEAGVRGRALGLNLAGLALLFVPVLLMREGTGSASLVPTLVCWGAGLALTGTGALLMLAPLARWRDFLRLAGWPLAMVALAGLLAPILAIRLRPVWKVDWTADVTFAGVSWGMRVLGFDVEAYPDEKTIGAGEFYINIAPVCSGIEGMALVTIFVTIFLALFRHELRFPRALWLLPLGLVVSATLNTVRIVILLAIGLNGHPELAVGGFHSHAGWLMFTLIALGLVAVAKNVPALRVDGGGVGASAAPGAALPPLHRDPMAARILPFAVFMLSALVVSTVSQQPGVLYPLRALLLGAVVALFWPIYARLDWRLDPVAAAAGAAIGVMWVAIPVSGEASPPYGELAGGALLVWFVLRGVGTVLLVPLVEELFFRDYLEGKLRLGQGAVWAGFAALVSAGAFAALHDRWAEALVAGLVFSGVYRRTGRIGDAVLAHAVANAVVYGVALATGNLHII